MMLVARCASAALLALVLAGCAQAGEIGPAPPLVTDCVIVARPPVGTAPIAPPGPIHAPPQAAAGLRLQAAPAAKTGMMMFDALGWPAPRLAGVACVLP